MELKDLLFYYTYIQILPSRVSQQTLTADSFLNFLHLQSEDIKSHAGGVLIPGYLICHHLFVLDESRWRVAVEQMFS